SDPGSRLVAIMALARATGVCPFHRAKDAPPPDAKLRDRMLNSLLDLDWGKLNDEQRYSLVRNFEIIFNRFGKPDDALVAKCIAKLDPHFPAATPELNWLLCETLVYLQAPSVAAKGLQLIADAPTQEEQIEYARSLRMLKAGWTPALRTAYFEWLLK